MFIKYDENGVQIRNRVVCDCTGDEVRVEQDKKEEVDINNILKRYNADTIQHIQSMIDFKFDDVTGNDFQEMMDIMITAKDTFNNLPLELKKKFEYDPVKFMDFVHDESNIEEMYDLGLAIRPEEVSPIEVAVVSQPTIEPEPEPV